VEKSIAFLGFPIADTTEDDSVLHQLTRTRHMLQYRNPTPATPIDAMKLKVTIHAKRALVAFRSGDAVWLAKEEFLAAHYEREADRLQQMLGS
jgi:hypothetical protein